jgi:hypothetical protein
LSANQIFEDKDGTILALTSPTIKVNTLKFRVFGERQDDAYQPRVTIFMEVEGKGEKLQFQTTISQRDLDVQY